MELGAIAILYRDVDTAINFTLRAIAQLLGTASLNFLTIGAMPTSSMIITLDHLMSKLP